MCKRLRINYDYFADFAKLADFSRNVRLTISRNLRTFRKKRKSWYAKYTKISKKDKEVQMVGESAKYYAFTRK